MELLLSAKPGPRIHCAIVSNSPLDERSYEQKQVALRAALDDDLRSFLEADDANIVADDSVGAMVRPPAHTQARAYG